MVVVSADSHVGPSVADLRPYCEGKHLDEYDRFAADFDRRLRDRADDSNENRLLPNPSYKQFGFDDDEIAAAYEEAQRAQIRNARTRGKVEVDARLADMDFDGVAASVIFHGTQNEAGIIEPLPFTRHGKPAVDERWSSDDQDLVAAGAQIFNRWLADFCSVHPERHAGVCQIPVWDLERAVEMVRWAAESGLKAVNFPGPQRPSRPTRIPCGIRCSSCARSWTCRWSRTSAPNSGRSTPGPARTPSSSKRSTPSVVATSGTSSSPGSSTGIRG